MNIFWKNHQRLICVTYDGNIALFADRIVTTEDREILGNEVTGR